ncbi:MAG: desulfoferrodoxin family protein [Phycisphaerae bacterium]
MHRLRTRLYKCSVCDTVVEVLDGCGPEIACCGRPMDGLFENAAAMTGDDHRAFLQWTDDGLKVSIGPTPHPCESDHHIAWIEAIAGRTCCRQFLGPGRSPEVTFHIPRGTVTIRAYCTLHGLKSLTSSVQSPLVLAEVT